jgi:hypothetical protein
MTQEALKLALEKIATVNAMDYEYQAWAREALAQEQEPVAWVSEDVCKGQYIDGRPRKIWWECEKGVGTAFYTTSPQRTWVGLTDEEVEKLDCVQVIWQDEGEVEIHGIKEFYRNIESKLKEKNYGN